MTGPTVVLSVDRDNCRGAVPGLLFSRRLGQELTENIEETLTIDGFPRADFSAE